MQGIRDQLAAASHDERAPLLDDLASRAANGDGAAAADLAWAILRLRLTRPALRNYLISEPDVEAAEQATLVAVALRIASWRGEGHFTTWLHQVATNEARQLIRAESKHSSRAVVADTDDLGENFMHRVSSMIANEHAVREAIQQLDEKWRRALLLREEQGLTYDEIADTLSVPLSTAKTWVRRGRLELAELLRP